MKKRTTIKVLEAQNQKLNHELSEAKKALGEQKQAYDSLRKFYDDAMAQYHKDRIETDSLIETLADNIVQCGAHASAAMLAPMTKETTPEAEALEIRKIAITILQDKRLVSVRDRLRSRHAMWSRWLPATMGAVGAVSTALMMYMVPLFSKMATATSEASGAERGERRAAGAEG